jgi:hypothetical protein
MSSTVPTSDQRIIRSADSNSLLRMYDQARQLVGTAELRQQREKADRTVRRITAELEKRKITL